MVIKASAAGHVTKLLADLRSENPVVREAASARLIVIGSAAVDKLSAVASDPSPVVRIAAVRTLEGIGDPRALPALFARMDDADSSVAFAAIDASRTFLQSDRGPAAVDRLTRAALDAKQPQAVRVAAVQALAVLGESSIKPLLKALPPEVRDAVRSAPPSSRLPGKTSEDPLALRMDLDSAAHRSLADLLSLVRLAREREQTSDRPIEWIALRGAAHVALAKRGSRLALYDLKESLEVAEAPLPADFLAAVALVGDAASLQSIAAAYTRADRARTGSERARQSVWRGELADAFAAVVKRERLTRRHASIKQIEKRWLAAFEGLWPRR